jgi:hypothetical protein
MYDDLRLGGSIVIDFPYLDLLFIIGLYDRIDQV